MKRNPRSNRNNSNRRRNNRNTRVVKVVESRRNPCYPPPNQAKPKCTRVLRYFVTQAVANSDITGRCLLNLIVSTSTATTTAINVYEAVRILQISMYFAPSSVDNMGDTSGEIALNWRGERAPDTRITERGTLSHPACIKSRPPKESLASFWTTNQSNVDSVLCSLTVPAGTIIDMNLCLTIGDGTTRSVTLTAVGSTTGIEYMALDNAIAAGTVGGLFIRPDSLQYQALTTP